MAFNVMELIQGSLTSDNIGTIASALGMENETIKKGLGLALPLVLAGVLGTAKTPKGHEQLDSALASADTGMLGNLKNLLSGGGSSSLISTGTKLLSGLLGQNKAGSLGGALASSLGITKESSGSLMGLAAPMLMSLLAGKKKSEGLDTGRMVNMLMGQKDTISKAIPNDIRGQLKGSGILEDMMDDAGTVSGTGAGSVQPPSKLAHQPKEKSGSWLRWVIGGLVVLALLYFLSNMLGRDKPSGERSSMVSSADLTVGGVNLGNSVKDMFGGLGSALASITDASSARAAVPDLNKVQEQLGAVERAASSLPPAGRSALADMINASMPGVERTIEKLLGDSAIAPVVKPVLDDIMGRLAALARG